MSRRRISPTEWLIEDPATPHRSPGSYTVPAENVGHMRPIMAYGGILSKKQFRAPEKKS